MRCGRDAGYDRGRFLRVAVVVAALTSDVNRNRLPLERHRSFFLAQSFTLPQVAMSQIAGPRCGTVPSRTRCINTSLAGWSRPLTGSTCVATHPTSFTSRTLSDALFVGLVSQAARPNPSNLAIAPIVTCDEALEPVGRLRQASRSDGVRGYANIIARQRQVFTKSWLWLVTSMQFGIP